MDIEKEKSKSKSKSQSQSQSQPKPEPGGGGRRRNKSGPMIPAFGDWDSVVNDDMPITQYFESARQAGLRQLINNNNNNNNYNISQLKLQYHQYPYPNCPYPCSSSATTVDLYNNNNNQFASFNFTAHPPGPPSRIKMKNNKKMTVNKKTADLRAGKVCHADTAASFNDVVKTTTTTNNHYKNNPKAVDEDLYKIPPELLNAQSRPYNRKKKLGFISRCLVPCAA